MNALISSYDAILSDLDGVVYAGPDPIDGAVESLNKASETGVAVAYVTNNASRSVQTVADHLSSLGLSVDADHVVSAAQSAARLAADQLGAGAPVAICGSQALAECAREVGLRVVGFDESPRAVLQGFDPGLGWQDLAEASYTLANPSIRWIVSNTDLTIPKERGIAPGNGTLVNAVAAATGRAPEIAGKPGAAIFRTIMARLGVSDPVVVGDRLDTDILGANNAQLPSIAVMTGVQTWADIVNARTDERPTYVVGNLRELFDPYDQPRLDEVDGQVTAVIPDLVTATVQEDRVRIDAHESATETLIGRTAAAAWWAAHPETEEATSARMIRG
ncbi:HAD-IIA family hydrolase [Curtobacterium sp. S6]|uniref:HAD-IIA family hydrolase n=1 Tax=Curtobacterium sp. S6 TaxID=1479623 RepID=UPI0005618974|nr:HAD-IIA family hydrolase [Curtobacterium sp. S6]